MRVRLHVLRVCVLQQVIGGRGRPRKTDTELYADAAKMVRDRQNLIQDTQTKLDSACVQISCADQLSRFFVCLFELTCMHSHVLTIFLGFSLWYSQIREG